MPGSLLTDSPDPAAPAAVAATPASGAAVEASAAAAGETAKPAVAAAVPAAAAAVETPAAIVYDLKLPEGAIVDAGAVERVTAFATEHALPAEVAQKLLDREDSMVRGVHDAAVARHQAQVEQWLVDIQKDPEIGGAEHKASVEAARRFVAVYGDDALKKDLDASGYGNHPGLVRMLAKAGRAMREDRSINQGSGDAAREGATLDDYYPSMKKK